MSGIVSLAKVEQPERVLIIGERFPVMKRTTSWTTKVNVRLRQYGAELEIIKELSL